MYNTYHTLQEMYMCNTYHTLQEMYMCNTYHTLLCIILYINLTKFT